MKRENLKVSEAIGLAGSILLVISLFLPWYGVAPNFLLSGRQGPATLTAWQAFSTLDILFLLAAVAPVVLAVIVAAGGSLSWPRGEVTAIVGLVTLVVVVFNGIVFVPGDGGTALKWGWLVAFVASLGIFFGGAIRSAEHGARRRPPGSF